jgi:hypothetical protein
MLFRTLVPILRIIIRLCAVDLLVRVVLFLDSLTAVTFSVINGGMTRNFEQRVNPRTSNVFYFSSRVGSLVSCALLCGYKAPPNADFTMESKPLSVKGS